MLSSKNLERARKVVELARSKSNELEHSAKGTTWKNHKYTKKVGDRYYYEDEADDQLVDLDELIETPDFESLPSKMEKIRPEWIKNFNNATIWSPNKNNKDTLVAKGKDKIDDLFKKHRKRTVAKK